MKLGIIREGKIPPDKRVPFSPEQCERIMNDFKEVEIYVQTSPVRCFADEEYEKMGIAVVDELDQCDVIFGVKEVPLEMLIEGKTYFFFSHTIKKQSYNRNLLHEILSKQIQMVDYETLTDSKGRRLAGFGRYAGVVGAYNGLMTYGKKTKSFELKPANFCSDRVEMEKELTKLVLPSQFKIVLTGGGRVALGALETLTAAKIKEVSPEDFLEKQFDQPVFTRLDPDQYTKRSSGKWEAKEFYTNPSEYSSDFMKYARISDLYIACHYWDSKAPYIFTRDDMKSKEFNIQVVADVSCDIDGPVACTIRPSTIANPVYGYHRQEEKEVSFDSSEAIAVMAVDNLPCELPKDASEDFGDELITKVLPFLINPETDVYEIIFRATITKGGKLCDKYSYLQDYVSGGL